MQLTHEYLAATYRLLQAFSGASATENHAYMTAVYQQLAGLHEELAETQRELVGLKAQAVEEATALVLEGAA